MTERGVPLLPSRLTKSWSLQLTRPRPKSPFPSFPGPLLCTPTNHARLRSLYAQLPRTSTYHARPTVMHAHQPTMDTYLPCTPPKHIEHRPRPRIAWSFISVISGKVSWYHVLCSCRYRSRGDAQESVVARNHRDPCCASRPVSILGQPGWKKHTLPTS